MLLELLSVQRREKLGDEFVLLDASNVYVGKLREVLRVFLEVEENEIFHCAGCVGGHRYGLAGDVVGVEEVILCLYFKGNVDSGNVITRQYKLGLNG